MKRSAAILASLALAILTLSVCCTSTPLMTEQHGCCKGRCVSKPGAAPLLALMPTIVFSIVPELQPDAVAVSIPSPIAATPRFFAPILTVQLRI